MNVKKILAPVDFSRGSRRSVEAALGLAGTLDAEVTVLHVVDYPTPYTNFDSLLSDSVEGGMTFDTFIRDRARQDMESFLAEVDGQPDATLYESGMAAETISKTAQEKDFDLIVMGTHGRTGLGRLIVGSVAERTVRMSDVPVLIIPTHEG